MTSAVAIQVPDITGDYYVVLDTNVLMHNIVFVRNLTSKTINGDRIVIYIPHKVRTELNGLLIPTRHRTRQAREALAFIAEMIVQQHPAVMIQTAAEMTSWMQFGVQDEDLRVADDLILEAAFGLINTGVSRNVILCTDDVNLLNKCKMNKIRCEKSTALNLLLD